jgi:hypothetical protein
MTHSLKKMQQPRATDKPAIAMPSRSDFLQNTWCKIIKYLAISSASLTALPRSIVFAEKNHKQKPHLKKAHLFAQSPPSKEFTQ